MLAESVRDALVNASANDEVVGAICEVISTYKRGLTEIQTHMMEKYLNDFGYSFSHSQVVGGFRKLEAIGVGKYWQGRHGATSRFEFVEKVTVIAQALPGGKTSATSQPPIVDVESQENDVMIAHNFVLRPGLIVTLSLPADLTESEAQRLSQFVGCLSFDDSIS